MEKTWGRGPGLRNADPFRVAGGVIGALALRWERIATHDLVCASEKMLHVAGLQGWGFFDSQRPLRGPVHTLRRATVCLDMGSDNLAKISYLLNKKRLRITPFFSITHKIQRCMWAGVAQTGRQSEVLLATVVVTCMRAPWQGGAHGREICEALDSYVDRMHDDVEEVRKCPVMAVCAPLIARQRGWSHPDFVTAEGKVDILRSLKKAKIYHVQPANVATTRWNTVNDACEDLLKEAGEFLVATIDLGVRQGWAKGQLREAFFRRLKTAETSLTEQLAKGKISVKENKERLMRLRQLMKNPMHLATIALMSAEWTNTIRMFIFATYCWRVMHGKVQSYLSSPAHAASWHLEIVSRCGSFWDAFEACGYPWQRMLELTNMFFVIDVEGVPEAVLRDENHPFFLEQQLLAATLWNNLRCQRKQFLQGFNHYFDGYPGVWAEMLHRDALVRGNAWVSFVLDFSAYRVALTVNHPRVKKICERSYFQWPEVAEMMELTLTHEVAPPESFMKNVKRVFDYHGDSLVAEKFFQKGWDLSTDGTAKKAISTHWRQPVKAKTLTKDFRFPGEVEVADVVDRDGPKTELPKNIHRPAFRNLSMNYDDLPSRKGKKPDWASYAATTWHSLVTEARFLRHCFLLRDWSLADRCWRTEFARESLVLMHQGAMVMCEAFVPPMMMLTPVDTFTMGPTTFLVHAPILRDYPKYDMICRFPNGVSSLTDQQHRSTSYMRTSGGRSRAVGLASSA